MWSFESIFHAYAGEDGLEAPDPDSFLGWAKTLVGYYTDTPPFEQEASDSAAREQRPQVKGVLPKSMGEGRGALWPHVAAIEVQVLMSKGGDIMNLSGKANSDHKLGWHARCWLYSLTEKDLKDRELPLPGVNMAELRDYGFHVHYVGDALIKARYSSPLCLAALAAITGLKSEPEVNSSPPTYSDI